MANVVHGLSSFKVGGAERFVLDLAQVQNAAGDSVVVFSTSDDSQEALVDEVRDLPCEGVSSSGSKLSDYCRLLRCFNASSENVFHIHSPWVLRYFLLLLPLLYLKGISIVYTRHGLNPLPGKGWGVVHAFARPWVSYVTFVSEAGLEVFNRRFTWPRAHLKAISNGVFVPLDVSKEKSEKIRLGSVGRMVELKGQRDLITAVSLINKEGSYSIDIHFFGDGPERAGLEALSEQKLLPGQAVFHGMVLDRDQVYSSFDILVVNSEQEGLSLAIMEAMAREIPVVATNVGDSPKLVIDSVTGFLYEYKNVKDLVTHLKALCGDSGKRELLGQEARGHMIKNFSLESVNQEYQQCYKRH